LQIVAKGKSIFAQQAEKMKVSEASEEMLLATRKTRQQTDIVNENHQFGKESVYLMCILNH
jgi:predicted RND superfamily exporter protein